MASTLTLCGFGNERLFKPGNRLLLTAHALQAHGQVGGGSGQLRIQFERLLERGFGRFVAAGGCKGAAVFNEGLRIGRLGPGGRFESVERCRQIVLLPVEERPGGCGPRA